MKKLNSVLFAAVAFSTVLGASAASTADLAVKAPYAAPAPAFTWTGCYVGVHAGAGVVHDQGYQPQNLQAADRHGIGALAGGQIGCNYQTGMLVLGIEGEGYWSGMAINQDQFGFNNLANTVIGSVSIKNRWDYDVAGRIGVAFDRALVYGKAGWTVGRFDWSSALAPAICGNFCVTESGKASLDGLLIGVGLEYAFTNNWTTKFEYDYLGFGAKNVLYTTTIVNTTRTQNVSADKHIFKVGINYLFNATGPVVAKY